jgi:soluble lytic murein transglycosylase-like protein
MSGSRALLGVLFGVFWSSASWAETLQLPPGAVVIDAGLTSLVPRSAEAELSNTPKETELPRLSPLGARLPPGAVVIRSNVDGARVQHNSPSREAPPQAVAEAIAGAAKRHGLSPALIEAVAWQESRFDHSRVSPRGARGVMQLMPTTARWLQIDARDMRDNINGGAAYLAALLHRYSGNLALALAAYNAGPNAVQKHGGVPPYAETQAYVRAVLHQLAPKPGEVDMKTKGRAG